MPRTPRPNNGRKPTILALPQTVNELVEYVRIGGTDYIAAEAAGISVSAFYRYMQVGEEAALKVDDWLAEAEENGKELTEEQARAKLTARERVYLDFRERITQARAEARLHREIQVAATKPLDWLERNARDRPAEPERRRPPRPGWSKIPMKVEMSLEVEENADPRLELLARLAAIADRRRTAEGDPEPDAAAG